MSKGQVYRGNKPDCAYCGKPIEDSEGRDQRAGKVYHSDQSPCREAYLATSGRQVTDSGDGGAQADDSASDDLQLSDDDLARSWITLSEEGRRLMTMADGALFALESRLIARDASKFDGEHFRGAMKKTGYDHTIDDQARFMERLKEYLSTPVYKRAFPVPSPAPAGVDHRVLNDLTKLGGPVAAIINEERRSAERRPKLKIEPIVQVQEEDIPYE